MQPGDGKVDAASGMPGPILMPSRSPPRQLPVRSARAKPPRSSSSRSPPGSSSSTPRSRRVRHPTDRRPERDVAASHQGSPPLARAPLLRENPEGTEQRGNPSALAVLEGLALFDGVEHPVHVRVADATAPSGSTSPTRHGGDPDHRDGLARYRRSSGEVPPRAGDAPFPDPIRRRVRRPSLAASSTSRAPTTLRLMVAWLVMALRPAGPFPVLALHGEQGSGKSTAAEALPSLVDPNEALLRPAPRNERDLVIAGANGRVIALENLSEFRSGARMPFVASPPAQGSAPARFTPTTRSSCSRPSCRSSSTGSLKWS